MEEHAKSFGAVVDRDPKKQCIFKNAIRIPFESLGFASLDLSFPGDPSRYWKCDFAIVDKCAAPMVLGKAFLDKAEIFTKLRHNMIKAGLAITKSFGGQFKKVWRLMLMESSRQKMSCYVDGEPALVDADSGADIDLVSLDYAQLRKSTRKRFYVLDGLESKVVLGDETIEEYNVFGLDDIFMGVEDYQVNEAFCMIQWVERYDQLEREVDALLGGTRESGPSPNVSKRKKKWPFSRNKGLEPTPEGIKSGLRNRLDVLDMMDTNYEEYTKTQQATLSDSALLTAENDNRKRRETHKQLRLKILSEIAKLEPP